MLRTSAVLVLLATVLSSPFPATATEPFAMVSYAVDATPMTTPRSVRNQGMGGAGVADAMVAANAVYNPANLLGDDGVSAFYGHYQLYDLIDVYDAGIAATKTWAGTGVRGAVAVRQVFHRFDQQFQTRTVFYPEGTTSYFQSKDRGTSVVMAVGAPLGRASVAVGLGAEYATVDNTFDDISAWAFDFGTRIDLPLEDSAGNRFVGSLGMSILNAGNGFESGSLRTDSPQQVRAGVGARFSSARTVRTPLSSRRASVVSVAFDADVVADDPVATNPLALVGAEIGVIEFIYLRAGAGALMAEQGDGGSFGGGLALDYGVMRARADVAVYPSRSEFEDQETVFGFTLQYLP